MIAGRVELAVIHVARHAILCSTNMVAKRRWTIKEDDAYDAALGGADQRGGAWDCSELCGYAGGDVSILN